MSSEPPQTCPSSLAARTDHYLELPAWPCSYPQFAQKRISCISCLRASALLLGSFHGQYRSSRQRPKKGARAFPYKAFFSSFVVPFFTSASCKCSWPRTGGRAKRNQNHKKLPFPLPLPLPRPQPQPLINQEIPLHPLSNPHLPLRQLLHQNCNQELRLPMPSSPHLR